MICDLSDSKRLTGFYSGWTKYWILASSLSYFQQHHLIFVNVPQWPSHFSRSFFYPIGAQFHCLASGRFVGATRLPRYRFSTSFDEGPSAPEGAGSGDVASSFDWLTGFPLKGKSGSLPGLFGKTSMAFLLWPNSEV